MKKMKKWLLLVPLVLVACSRVDEMQESPQTEASVSQSEVSSSENAESKTTTEKEFEPASVEVVEAYPNLMFEEPLYYTTTNDQDNTAFVVERTGKIRYFENKMDTKETITFIDLSSKINTEGNEMGLLGLAFHPDFDQNGYFFVNYTSNDGTVIARFEADPETLEVKMETESTVLTFPQPYANHNGGHLAFGPDGYLYIGVGDGGGSGDPEGNAQDLNELYGKLLRIDVDQSNNGQAYGIPADNPFTANTDDYREEIYAYGLRNPWRFSFDTEKDRLWLADVGENTIEEIDWIENGLNYGWNLKEGTNEFNPAGTVNPTELRDPIFEYDHAEGQSITGGYVYYGKENPSLTGSYIYGDFISGKIWALWKPDEATEGKNVELADTDLMISSFGVTQDGELIIVDFNGKLYTVEEKD
ncbi:MAG: PQQ-dependent sugar dehydrogenase [Carnobacterium sp.]|uniref:PQQ-dependent sugar dehydrogenase n=1 Tax=Carnobacterium sp. TaxID=48221 RepID=UPI002FC94E9E